MIIKALVNSRYHRLFKAHTRRTSISTSMDDNNNRLKRKLIELEDQPRRDSNPITLCSSVYIKQLKNYCIRNRVYQHDKSDTWEDVYENIIDGEDDFEKKPNDLVTVELSKSSSFTESFVPDSLEPVRVALDFDKELKYVKFIVDRQVPENEIAPDPKTPAGKNAFDILMCNSTQQTKLPKKVSVVRETAKDKVYNQLVDDIATSNCFFPNAMSDVKVSMYMSTLCNAIWYISGNMEKINSRSKHDSKLTAVPIRFMRFEEANNWRKRKQKQPRLSSKELRLHCDCLVKLFSAPFTQNWPTLQADIENLTIALSSYADFLDKSNKEQNFRQSQLHPTRELAKDVWLEHRKKSEVNILDIYQKLNSCIQEVDFLTPVYFDEDQHVDKKFSKSYTRYRYFQNLSLENDVSMLRFNPGGSILGTVFIWKIPADMPTSDLMTTAARIMNLVSSKVPQYHTRQMRKDFSEKYSLVSGCRIPPHMLKAIYSDLTLDASADQNPLIDNRVRMAVLGEEPDLIVDLRHLNKGRPGDTFTEFFNLLEKEVEALVAADERRHNIEHVSKFISVRDLIQQIKTKLPEGSPIPSEATVLFAFVPSNSHSNVAKLYNGRIPLRLKVQTRQLHANHIDDHYCAAVFKYMRHYAIKYRDETTFVCLDDKSKLDYGEPGMFTSTGVRGKKSLVPINSVLSCLDHDIQSKGSLTPSVTLDVEIPNDITDSFYQGSVTVSLKDSIFQASSPFRHIVELHHLLQEKGAIKPVLMIFSDGGPDHRITYHAVKISLIILFRRLNLEMLIAGRTAPGHSWANPVERIMSLLNLSFQNMALARDEMTAELEQTVRSCSSMADIRKKSEKEAPLKDKWIQSLSTMIDTLQTRIQRVELKSVPFKCIAPATDHEIEVTEMEIADIDPKLEKGKYQQQHINKAKKYKEFLVNHCVERQYSFQIQRCNDENCCQPPSERRPWLPDPVIDGEHYKPFDSVLGKATTENDRPSLTKQTLAAVAEAEQGCKNTVLVAQNVRKTVKCHDCDKPRCIYSKTKLTTRDIRSLNRLLERYDYCCGSIICPDGDILHGKVFVRLRLDCRMAIEFPYYASNIARNDICCYCCAPDTAINQQMSAKFRVVLPVCEACVHAGCEVPKRNPIK